MITRLLFIVGQIACRQAGISRRWAAFSVAVVLALTPLHGLAHGGALELSVSPANIAAGDEVTISGEGFAANASLALHLTGPNGDAHFSDVVTDDEGEFTQPVRIPGSIVPGLYLIRAENADQEAAAEVTIGAMAGMTEPSDDRMPARARTAAWQASALGLFLALGIAGLALARPRRRGALTRAG